MDRTISTVVIDDDALVAAAIGYLAGHIGGVKILGVAMSGWGGMALIHDKTFQTRERTIFEVGSMRRIAPRPLGPIWNQNVARFDGDLSPG